MVTFSVPRVKAVAIGDVPKITFTLGILISQWMRTDLMPPGPELEPELISALRLRRENRSLSPIPLKYGVNHISW